MSKMGLHSPFGHLKHKLWSKERPGVKLAVWLLTIKSQELTTKSWELTIKSRELTTKNWESTTKSQEPTWFRRMQASCNIPLKSSWPCFNFSLDLIAIKGLHAKLCALKVTKVPTMGISGLPLGSPETKSHLDVAPMERHKLYYKGKEGGGFPQVWPWWVLWMRGCPWLVLAPKVF
jgi:hypothetical protein